MVIDANFYGIGIKSARDGNVSCRFGARSIGEVTFDGLFVVEVLVEKFDNTTTNQDCSESGGGDGVFDVFDETSLFAADWATFLPFVFSMEGACQRMMADVLPSVLPHDAALASSTIDF